MPRWANKTYHSCLILSLSGLHCPLKLPSDFKTARVLRPERARPESMAGCAQKGMSATACTGCSTERTAVRHREDLRSILEGMVRQPDGKVDGRDADLNREWCVRILCNHSSLEAP